MKYTESETAQLVRVALDDARTDRERHHAFGSLVARYQDLAFGYAYAVLRDAASAEEATQESFVVAWRSLKQLRTGNAFPAWLKRIVVTRCYRIRDRNDEASRCLPLASAIFVATDSQLSPTAQLLQSETNAEVHRAIGVLPEAERLVVILFYINDYSRQEVAAFLNISPVMVKKRLAAARTHLKERLLTSMQEDLNAIRPSNTEDFAARVLSFTKLFSALVDSGVSLLKTMDQLIDEEDNSEFRAALTQIRTDLAAGSCLSQAMRPYPQYFSERYLAEIRNGEVSGELEVALNRLAK